MKQDNGIEEKDYFVYKIITCLIRFDILDVYSKLEKWIGVLVDLAKICVKAWYLCKEHFCDVKMWSCKCKWYIFVVFICKILWKKYMQIFIWSIWQYEIELKIRDLTRKENNSKLLVWVVSSSCTWNCMFGQWALLAYIIPQLLKRLAQLLIGLKSPNRDSKFSNKDSLYWIFSLAPNKVHPLKMNLYISILSSEYHLY